MHPSSVVSRDGPRRPIPSNSLDSNPKGYRLEDEHSAVASASAGPSDLIPSPNVAPPAVDPNFIPVCETDYELSAKEDNTYLVKEDVAINYEDFSVFYLDSTVFMTFHAEDGNSGITRDLSKLSKSETRRPLGCCVRCGHERPSNFHGLENHCFATQRHISGLHDQSFLPPMESHR